MGNTMVSQSWVDDVQARIREQSAEIERLKAQARGALAGLVEVGEVLSTDPKESPLAAARRVVAERDTLKAELARLAPSGQVAEGADLVDAMLRMVPGCHKEACPCDYHIALSHLTAKAQGYEAMKARDDAWKAATTCDGPEQVAARARALREAVADANERRLRAETERDEAELLGRIVIQERDDAREQRDAAVDRADQRVAAVLDGEKARDARWHGLLCDAKDALRRWSATPPWRTMRRCWRPCGPSSVIRRAARAVPVARQ